MQLKAWPKKGEEKSKVDWVYLYFPKNIFPTYIWDLLKNKQAAKNIDITPRVEFTRVKIKQGKDRIL